MAKNGPQEHDEKQKFRGRWDLIHGHHDFERLEKLIPFTSFFKSIFIHGLGHEWPFLKIYLKMAWLVTNKW